MSKCIHRERERGIHVGQLGTYILATCQLPSTLPEKEKQHQYSLQEKMHPCNLTWIPNIATIVWSSHRFQSIIFGYPNHQNFWDVSTVSCSQQATLLWSSLSGSGISLESHRAKYFSLSFALPPPAGPLDPRYSHLNPCESNREFHPETSPWKLTLHDFYSSFRGGGVKYLSGPENGTESFAK